jgi:hypothetical protein
MILDEAALAHHAHRSTSQAVAHPSACLAQKSIALPGLEDQPGPVEAIRSKVEGRRPPVAA